MKQKNRLVSPCLTTSVVLELYFGRLAFPAVSPHASVGGCSASETAFTSVNLGNHCLEFPNFRVLLAHGCLRTNCDKLCGKALKNIVHNLKARVQ